MAENQTFYFLNKTFFFIYQLIVLNCESSVYSETLGVRRKKNMRRSRDSLSFEHTVSSENAEILGVLNKYLEKMMPRFAEFLPHNEKRKDPDYRHF